MDSNRTLYVTLSAVVLAAVIAVVAMRAQLSDSGPRQFESSTQKEIATGGGGKAHAP